MRWAEEGDILDWTREKQNELSGEVKTDELFKTVRVCSKCKLEFSEGGNRKICPQCGGRIEKQSRLKRTDYSASDFFGEGWRDRRSRMAYINLSEEFEHPLSPNRKIKLLPVIPPAYRPLPKSEGGEQIRRDDINRIYISIIRCAGRVEVRARPGYGCFYLERMRRLWCVIRSKARHG